MTTSRPCLPTSRADARAGLLSPGQRAAASSTQCALKQALALHLHVLLPRVMLWDSRSSAAVMGISWDLWSRASALGMRAIKHTWTSPAGRPQPLSCMPLRQERLRAGL